MPFQLRNFSSIKKPIFSAKIGDFCIGDISVDDPQMSPNASNVDNGCDEAIGNNLILDLKEDVERLTEELDKEKEMVKQEIEKSEFLERKVSELEEEVESRRQEVGKLEKTKVSEIEKLNQELNREKEKSRQETAKISYLEEKISSLKDEIKENAEQIFELKSGNFELAGKLSREELHGKQKLEAEIEKHVVLTEKVLSLQIDLEAKEKEIVQLTKERSSDAEKLYSERKSTPRWRRAVVSARRFAPCKVSWLKRMN